MDPGASCNCLALGSGLVTGVGPIVRVMEIKEEFESDSLCPIGCGQGVVKVVWQLDGSGEDAQADPVVAVIVENLECRFGDAILLELGALLLSLRQKRDVGADDVLRASSSNHLRIAAACCSEGTENHAHKTGMIHRSPRKLGWDAS
jgi:hypothetical protein